MSFAAPQFGRLNLPRRMKEPPDWVLTTAYVLSLCTSGVIALYGMACLYYIKYLLKIERYPASSLAWMEIIIFYSVVCAGTLAMIKAAQIIDQKREQRKLATYQRIQRQPAPTWDEPPLDIRDDFKVPLFEGDEKLWEQKQSQLFSIEAELEKIQRDIFDNRKPKRPEH